LKNIVANIHYNVFLFAKTILIQHKKKYDFIAMQLSIIQSYSRDNNLKITQCHPHKHHQISHKRLTHTKSSYYK